VDGISDDRPSDCYLYIVQQLPSRHLGSLLICFCTHVFVFLRHHVHVHVRTTTSGIVASSFHRRDQKPWKARPDAVWDRLHVYDLVERSATDPLASLDTLRRSATEKAVLCMKVVEAHYSNSYIYVLIIPCTTIIQA
jgi:hypothetical protein